MWAAYLAGVSLMALGCTLAVGVVWVADWLDRRGRLAGRAYGPPPRRADHEQRRYWAQHDRDVRAKGVRKLGDG